MPSTASNAAVGSVTAPPNRAQGTLASASGQKSRWRKCPARQNCTVAIDATITLSTSAVGRMLSGAMPTSAMVAR